MWDSQRRKSSCLSMRTTYSKDTLLAAVNRTVGPSPNAVKDFVPTILGHRLYLGTKILNAVARYRS